MVKKKVLTAGLITAVIFSGCTNSVFETEAEVQGYETVSEAFQSEAYEYSPEDMDDSWSEEASTAIVFNEDTIDIKGSGASTEGSTVTVSSAGTYVFRGNLTDGQIIVDAGNDALVRLVFDGISIHNSESSAVYAKSADKTVIILAEGSENTVSDALEYIYGEGETEPNAAIFAKNDLTINGGGSLNVTGNYNNGIGTKDILCITGGNIKVTAVNDGLRGKDGIAVLKGTFVIDAENDGIKSNHDTNEEKGFIVLEGGSYTINAGHDGIQAETDLTITGGTYTVFTGGGSENAPAQQESFRGFGSGNQADTAEDSESMKGLKAGTLVTITGGEFVIDSEDDAIHSNGDVTITEGAFIINTGDDGVHADDALVIDGGNIRIEYSYEGLEGSTVDINGGNIYVYATDDGINAAGGSDANLDGPMGKDRFGANDNNYIRITGGTVEVVSKGDGIDSNGALYLDGGYVYVSGPTSGADSALDSDGVKQINGGVLVSATGAGMFESPSSTESDQPSIVLYFSQSQEAETKLSLKDEQGSILAEYTPVNKYQIVVFSAPELAEGHTYSIYLEDILVTEVTLADVVNYINNDGEVLSGISGMGPGNGFRGDNSGNGGERPERGNMPVRGEDNENQQFGSMESPEAKELPQGMEPPLNREESGLGGRGNKGGIDGEPGQVPEGGRDMSQGDDFGKPQENMDGGRSEKSGGERPEISE